MNYSLLGDNVLNNLYNLIENYTDKNIMNELKNMTGSILEMIANGKVK
jgi:hypothetical protein